MSCYVDPQIVLKQENTAKNEKQTTETELYSKTQKEIKHGPRENTHIEKEKNSIRYMSLLENNRKSS